jgi:hypothetical protein
MHIPKNKTLRDVRINGEGWPRNGARAWKAGADTNRRTSSFNLPNLPKLVPIISLPAYLIGEVACSTLPFIAPALIRVHLDPEDGR